MISSGALPNVAFSKPPIASPVRSASCSVESTIRRAMGTIASAAEKNNTGGGTCASSRSREMGMNANSQLTEGLSENAIRSGLCARRARLVHAADDGEEESGRPAAHQDAGQCLHAADETPVGRQHQIAIARRRVGHGAEV